MNSKGAVRIGIFGGVFDPIHLGHLVMVEVARDWMRLDKVLFVPVGDPPHKRRGPYAGAEDRFQMVKLALPPDSTYEVSRVEVDRPGPSFAVDTVATLRRSAPQAEHVYIIGADAISEIMTWREPRKLLEMVEFCAVNRPGTRLTRARLNGLLGPELSRNVTIARGPGVDLSSSEIRRRVCEGETIRFLVPDAVRAYIMECNLYRRMEK